jgi:hypothetical protein
LLSIIPFYPRIAPQSIIEKPVTEVTTHSDDLFNKQPFHYTQYGINNTSIDSFAKGTAVSLKIVPDEQDALAQRGPRAGHSLMVFDGCTAGTSRRVGRASR